MDRLRTLPNPAAEAEADAGDWTALYEAFVSDLKKHGVGSITPGVGEMFPNLSLPDTSGVYRSIRDMCRSRPMIVSFQRGLWCPYCSHELLAWATMAPSLAEAGVTLTLISGELGQRADALATRAGGNVVMLCDVDHGAALACGLAFRVSDEMRQRYLDFGLDLGKIYGSEGWFLPIPATFILDEKAIVRFAFVEPDFRIRVHPEEVAAVALKLTTD